MVIKVINAPSIPDVHVTDATPIVSGIRNNMTMYATIGLYAQQKDVTTIFYRNDVINYEISNSFTKSFEKRNN